MNNTHVSRQTTYRGWMGLVLTTSLLSAAPGVAIAGDFDNDGDLDLDDIDALVMEIVAGTNSPSFDLTNDGLVDVDDLSEWRLVGAIANGFAEAYPEGDANLDGSVDGADYTIWADNFGTSNSWSGADFDASGLVDDADYTIWADNFGTTIPRAVTIEWAPLFMDFGIVPVGSTESRTLTLTHAAGSSGWLKIDSIEYTFNQQGAFGMSAPVPADLLPGESVEVELSFTPSDFSFFMADLLVTSNATNTPNGLVYSFMGQGAEVDDCFPLISCGGVCVDVTSDINNCGGCANFCPEPDNASALCETSNCGFVCDAGYEPLGDECIPIGTSIVGLTNLLINYWSHAVYDENPPTIVGLGPGKSAGNRRDAFEHMLLSASELVSTGDYENACGQLRAAYLKSDGGYPFVMPPDFVAGEATAGLSAHIVAVIEELDGLLPEGCPLPEPTAKP